MHQIAHGKLRLPIAVARIDHNTAVDPQAAQRRGQIAAEINLGDVIDANPAGDVEDPAGNVLGAIVDDVRSAAGTGSLGLFRELIVAITVAPAQLASCTA